MTDDGWRIAPTNVRQPPLPRATWEHPMGGFLPCLVRLRWPGNKVEIRPGEVLRLGRGVVKVRWTTRLSREWNREAWLPRQDVSMSLRYQLVRRAENERVELNLWHTDPWDEAGG